ncbi:AraC-like ligand-binding domain-containing protein [Roseinatronobacter sp. NSM]|uniref:AraC-like ligand-binding domain-containing protein n=1 Tax=Roseinatronobacter sp. NSM TaxID=3457785 RepID=UPI004036D9A2
MQPLWTTASVPQNESLSYWVEAVCRTYTALDCEERNRLAPFYGQIDAGMVGEIGVTQVRASAQKVRRTRRSIARHDEDKLLFSIQKRGRCTVVQDGRVAALTPGDFALYDTTRPYELIFDAEFAQYVVAVPGHALRPLLKMPERLTARRIPGGSSIGRAVLNAIETVAWNNGDLGYDAQCPMEEALRGLLSAGALSLLGAELRKSDTASGARRAAIKAYVFQHLRDPALCVGMIAAAQGVDVSTIHRAFDGEDETLSRWIWIQRLENARRDISDPSKSHLTLTEIAFFWGFNDMAHFSRAFKARFDQAPRVVRQQSLALR